MPAKTPPKKGSPALATDPVCARDGCDELKSQHDKNGCKGAQGHDNAKLVCPVMCPAFLEGVKQPSDNIQPISNPKPVTVAEPPVETVQALEDPMATQRTVEPTT